jgi:hypothetical protein
MDNPEKTKGAVNNGQSRETGHTRHTRHSTMTSKTKTIHRKLNR